MLSGKGNFCHHWLHLYCRIPHTSPLCNSQKTKCKASAYNNTAEQLHYCEDDQTIFQNTRVKRHPFVDASCNNAQVPIIQIVVLWVMVPCILVGWVSAFQRNILTRSPGSSAWRWQQYISPKRWHAPTRLHGVVFHSMNLHCRENVRSLRVLISFSVSINSPRNNVNETSLMTFHRGEGVLQHNAFIICS